MDIVLASLIGLLSGILIGSVLSIKVMRRIHILDGEDLIRRMNHTGRIPLASTALGLIKLVLRVVSKLIDALEELYERRDPDTSYAILGLRSLKAIELSILNERLEDFLESQRNYLREYQYKQNKMAQRTTLKFSNLTKGSTTGTLLLFGCIEVTLAYFTSAEWLKDYTWGIWIVRLFPWLQLLAGQVKMFVSPETPPDEKPQVTISGEKGTSLKVENE